MRTIAGLIVTAFLAQFIAAPPPAQASGTVIYVDADATGAHDGTSWADGYTTLQDAIDWSNAHGTGDYELWVAEGVYYPDEGGSHVDNDRTESFRLNYDNVHLYAGFDPQSDADEWDERDPAAHVTTLSGDIDQDGTPANNAYHVLYLDGETHEPLGAATVIDGLLITAGNADGSNWPDHVGGGLYCAGSGSGNACSPTLTNVIFSDNAAFHGGGMFNDGDSGTSSPTLTNVTFDTAFAAPLSVTLSEVGGPVLPGATITFTAPAAGASIAPPTTVTTTTNASGIASSPVAANGTPGSYHVTAAAGAASVSFSLTNTTAAQWFYVYLPIVTR